MFFLDGEKNFSDPRTFLNYVILIQHFPSHFTIKRFNPWHTSPENCLQFVPCSNGWAVWYSNEIWILDHLASNLFSTIWIPDYSNHLNTGHFGPKTGWSGFQTPSPLLMQKDTEFCQINHLNTESSSKSAKLCRFSIADIRICIPSASENFCNYISGRNLNLISNLVEVKGRRDYRCRQSGSLG